jgi:hypothetical protein
MEVVRALPSEKIHLSVYSPPFAGLYNYSSSERDFSNCASYDEFFAQYGYLVEELARVTMRGRMTAVHCMDVPTGNTGRDGLIDFPGDIVRLHKVHGFDYVARYCVWKEPYAVRMRTLAKGLAHQTVAEDASRCSAANADYLLVFRRHGDNPVPIEHPTGLLDYAGARPVPKDIVRFRGHTGKQTENRYSQWIWRQYASAFWDDVRLNRVLPFQDCKEADDEKHVHPLQLDVIDRVVALWSNPGETVFTPFMGVGSEVYSAVRAGRRGIGAELKTSYYRQAIANLRAAETEGGVESSPQDSLFEPEFLEGEAEGRGSNRRPGIKESGVLTAK